MDEMAVPTGGGAGLQLKASADWRTLQPAASNQSPPAAPATTRRPPPRLPWWSGSS